MTRRVFALTGTPGVGKTALVSRLRRRGFRVIAIEELLSEPGVVTGRDRRRGARIVDPLAVGRAAKKRWSGLSGIPVVEGHVSHVVPGVTHVLVLRLKPSALARRLERRGWSPTKVRENVEAEAVNVIAQEAMERHGRARCFELDVTGLRRHEVAARVAEILRGDARALKNVQIGRVNWTAEILRWF